MKLQAIAILTFLIFENVMAQETTTTKYINSTDMEALKLTQEWDKTFPQSDKVEHTKITFHNRYGITLAADLYKPKNTQGRLAAIAVSGPYGAVKEQVSGRYAQTLAERGFLTIAFDPSYYGESGGTPRYLTSPEISTEDFSAAVDYLTSRADVDPERIGILGICGWGGFALNAAANDPRIKATVTSTMYDMSRVNANGYFDAMSSDDRYKLREQLNAQRTEDYRDDSYVRDGGVLDPVTDDTPQFVKEYHDYYQKRMQNLKDRHLPYRWRCVQSFRKDARLPHSRHRERIGEVPAENRMSPFFSVVPDWPQDRRIFAFVRCRSPIRTIPIP